MPKPGKAQVSLASYCHCVTQRPPRLSRHSKRTVAQAASEKGLKVQAFLDEKALLVVYIVYVDLNPVQAGIVDSPEASGHTSIQRYITRP